jgi:hypothetical protein
MVTDAGDDRLDRADVPTCTARMSPTCLSVIDGSRELFEKTIAASLRRQPRRHALIGPQMGAGNRRCVRTDIPAIRDMAHFRPRPRPVQLRRAGKRGNYADPAHCLGCRDSSHATGATLAVAGDEP